jgi:nucleoside-diphosphate-sugar epimerase
VEGCLNILHQVEKAGIKRIVITSSIVTVLNPQYSFTDKGGHFLFSRRQKLTYSLYIDWNPKTKEQALTKKDMYQVAKTLAERKVWAFGESHPELEITTCA